MYFLHAISSDRQSGLLNVLGQIAMILGDKNKLLYKISFVFLIVLHVPWNLFNLFLSKSGSPSKLSSQPKYSDTSANEDNSFRNHVR